MSEIPTAAGYIPPQQKRMPRIDYIRGLMAEDRQRNPHLYLAAPDGLGPDRLFVENVAAMLGCTVDHVRRISRNELPAATIGKRVIYSRAAVEAYIDRRIQACSSRFIPERKPKKGSSRAVSGDAAVEEFDPVAALRRHRATR